VDPVTPNGIKTRLPAVVGMSDKDLHISSDIVMMVSGFLFGIGFGMIIGVYLL
tara:strand:+ start:1592 stop:1750 length:159 start_codon:yes stop_codon:yes gene_type:complete